MTRIPLPLDTTRPISSNHDSAFIGAYLEDGVAVLIHETGRYPDALLPDGSSTRDSPHIAISVTAASVNGKRYWYNVSVEASGRYVGSSRRGLMVYTSGEFPTTGEFGQQHDTPDALLAEAEAQLPRAKEVLAGLDAAYEAAAQRTGVLDQYSRRLSREAYEAACRECGVPAHAERNCSTWGWFSFPQYTADQVVEYRLAQRRGLEIEALKEAAQAARDAERAKLPRRAPARSGQLWEECERCGNEPVYMPLHLCDDCWPKGEAAV